MYLRMIAPRVTSCMVSSLAWPMADGPCRALVHTETAVPSNLAKDGTKSGGAESPPSHPLNIRKAGYTVSLRLCDSDCLAAPIFAP